MRKRSKKAKRPPKGSVKRAMTPKYKRGGKKGGCKK
jgi:hypothetical protein